MYKSLIKKAFLLVSLTIFYNILYCQDANYLIDSFKVQLKISSEDTNKVILYNKLASKYQNFAPDTTLIYADSALALSEKLNYALGRANSHKYQAIGNYLKGDYETALNEFLEATKIYEQLDDIKNLGSCANNIGNIYWSLNEIDNAIVKYKEASVYFKLNNNVSGLGTVYLNIGAMFDIKEITDSALFYYFESEKIFNELSDYESLASIYNNIGYVYLKKNKNNEAILYFKKSIELYESQNNLIDLPIAYSNIAEAYFKQKKFETGINYLNKGLAVTLQTGAKKQEKDMHLGLYQYWDSVPNHEKALYHFERYVQIKDSLNDLEKTSIITEIQTKYDTEKKQKENELLKANEIQNKLTIQRQRLVFLVLIAFILLILIIALNYFLSARQKKKTNLILTAKNAEISQQKEEIQTQNEALITQREEILFQNEILQQQSEEIKAQRDEIERQRDFAISQRDIVVLQNQLITDSINYAQRIQSTLLPSTNQLNEEFSDSFVFYLPRDIVSGDFYWFNKKSNNIKYLAVADCTGHGVPGAFMSVLGITLLNEILHHNPTISANQILENLRIMVKNSLKQNEKDNTRRDGMDIALCKFDFDNNILEFSGANNGAFVIGNNNFTELKSTRNPIGTYIKEIPFTSENYEFSKGDIIYFYTDGLIDQFGGERGEKLKISKLREIIVQINNLKLDEQQNYLSDYFKTWKSDKYKQIDDVLILAVKI